MSDRQERLEAAENYLHNNVEELVYILQELEEKCREHFGFTVHDNTEDFFNKEFKNDPYGAVVVTNNSDYDVDEEFLVYYEDQAEIESFSRAYPPVDIEINLTEITEMIIYAHKYAFITVSNELYKRIKDL